MADRNFGAVLKAVRESTIDETTGARLTQGRVADLVAEIVGEPVSRSLVQSWEANEVEVPRMKHLNALAVIFPELTVTDMLRLLGANLPPETPGLLDDERELLVAYRRLRNVPILQETALKVVRAMPVTTGPLGSSPRSRRPRQAAVE